ncbi:hypothetical protein B0H13DRAFT_1912336 [Mycena leptocephala]|nr:hypothetical protein B0H13DRAFT_1912336 [Mycena leptocephala]
MAFCMQKTVFGGTCWGGTGIMRSKIQSTSGTTWGCERPPRGGWYNHIPTNEKEIQNDVGVDSGTCLRLLRAEGRGQLLRLDERSIRLGLHCSAVRQTALGVSRVCDNAREPNPRIPLCGFAHAQKADASNETKIENLDFFLGSLRREKLRNGLAIGAGAGVIVGVLAFCDGMVATDILAIVALAGAAITGLIAVGLGIAAAVEHFKVIADAENDLKTAQLKRDDALNRQKDLIEKIAPECQR